MPIIGAVGGDKKVKVSTSDTKSEELEDKLVAGTGITITKLSPGGVEQLEISTGSSITEVVVAASSTEDLDTTALDDFCALNYKLCMFNTTEDRWKTLMLCGSKVTATSVEHNIYSSLGDRTLDIDIDFKVVTTNAILEAVNNETFPVTVRYRVETI